MVYWKPMRPAVPQECPHEKRMAARRLIRTREDATPTDSDGPYAANVTCLADIANEDLRLLELEIGRQNEEESPLRLIVIDPFPAELFAGPQGITKLIQTIKHLAEIAAWSETAIVLVANTSHHLRGNESNIIEVLETAVHSAWMIVKDVDRPERSGDAHERRPPRFVDEGGKYSRWTGRGFGR